MSGPGWPSHPPECPSQQLVSTRCGAGDSLPGQGDAAEAHRPGSRPLGASGSSRDRETARFVRQPWSLRAVLVSQPLGLGRAAVTVAAQASALRKGPWHRGPFPG